MEASPNTIAGYRDTFRLFLRFASKRLGKAPTKLKIEDLSAILASAFLAHIESDRGNIARSRNTRLSAFAARSSFWCLCLRELRWLLQFFPSAAQGLIETNEVLGHRLVALDQLVFGLIERALGVEHVDEAGKPVGVELVGQVQGIPAGRHRIFERTPADLFLGI